MAAGRVFSQVFNGRLVVVHPYRRCIEALVYAGESVESGLLNRLEMPEECRYLLHIAAEMAERQTPGPQKE